MKRLLFLLLLAPFAFAQSSDCDRSCCEASGGTWDSEYMWCDDAGSYYYECSSQCVENQSPVEYSSSFDYSCCGSMFILGAIGFGAFLIKR